jgi:hypothetical protein
LPKIAPISSFENARIVWVRTKPADPIARLNAVAVSSFGASMKATTSYAPSVQ